MFADTMFSTVKSKRSNTCAQVYCTDMGWTRIMPMLTKKSEAHETNVMVMDGAKEQTIGDFGRKCREAGCHIRQTEPHSPWMNMAEIGVRELRC